MARGNEVLVTGTEPKGRQTEGYVGVGFTFKAGMIVQKDPTIALKGGRHTYKPFTRGTSGKRPAGAAWLVLGQPEIGSIQTTTYAAGDFVKLYALQPGDEYNGVLADVAGTGDSHTAGEVLMLQDTTGKFIATTGSPVFDCALLLENVTQPVADTLAWMEWGG